MEILLATDYPLPPGEAGMKERYLDLTPRQTEVLGQIAIGFDQWHHPKTLEVLAQIGVTRPTVNRFLNGRTWV